MQIKSYYIVILTLLLATFNSSCGDKGNSDLAAFQNQLPTTQQLIPTNASLTQAEISDAPTSGRSRQGGHWISSTSLPQNVTAIPVQVAPAKVISGGNFTPTGSTYETSAFAIYPFTPNETDPGLKSNITIFWDPTNHDPKPATLWLGLSRPVSEQYFVWEWHPVRDAINHVSTYDMSPKQWSDYRLSNGQILAAVVLVENQGGSVIMRWIRLGDNVPPHTDITYSQLPSFIGQVNLSQVNDEDGWIKDVKVDFDISNGQFIPGPDYFHTTSLQSNQTYSYNYQHGGSFTSAVQFTDNENLSTPVLNHVFSF